jgi:threonine synthase
MTDKEKLQQWIKPGAIIPVTMDATRILFDALRETLAQPKKEWVGLTDEEILEEYRQSYGDDGNLTDVYFARAIEAKLKEKNT